MSTTIRVGNHTQVKIILHTLLKAICSACKLIRERSHEFVGFSLIEKINMY